jgi:hypothetical protein
MDGGTEEIFTIGGEFTSIEDVNSACGYAMSEVAIPNTDARWSMLVAVSYRDLDRDNFLTTAQTDGLGGSLGIRYYVTDMTSLALLAGYEEVDFVAYGEDVVTGTILFRHRLRPAGENISPYLKASWSLRFRETQPGESDLRGDSQDCLLTGGIGCEFMVSDDTGIALEVSCAGAINTEGEEYGGEDLALGVIATVSLIAY